MDRNGQENVKKPFKKGSLYLSSAQLWRSLFAWKVWTSATNPAASFYVELKELNQAPAWGQNHQGEHVQLPNPNWLLSSGFELQWILESNWTIQKLSELGEEAPSLIWILSLAGVWTQFMSIRINFMSISLFTVKFSVDCPAAWNIKDHSTQHEHYHFRTPYFSSSVDACIDLHGPFIVVQKG